MFETFTPDAPTLYDVLGIPRDASEPEIRLAYRRQSLRYHPDQGGAHLEFLKLKEAYDTLSDPTRRKRYDRTTFVDGNPPPDVDTQPERHNATDTTQVERQGAERLLRAILNTPDCTEVYLHSDLHPADADGPAWTEPNLLTVHRHHPTYGSYTETMGLREDLYADMATNIPLIKALTTDSTSRWQAYLEHMSDPTDSTTSSQDKENDPTDSMRIIGGQPPSNTTHDLAHDMTTTQPIVSAPRNHDV